MYGLTLLAQGRVKMLQAAWPARSTPCGNLAGPVRCNESQPCGWSLSQDSQNYSRAKGALDTLAWQVGFIEQNVDTDLRQE
jgi:hypothetical protein